MTNKLLGVLDYGDSHGYPFNKLFSGVKAVDRPKHFTSDIGALVFWGGTDIHSGLYKQRPSKWNQNRQQYPSVRHSVEWTLMVMAIQRHVPITGVCRGAQMLCAKAGGSLVQHANNHVGVTGHLLSTDDEDKGLWSNSCHHQIMILPEEGTELLAWTEGLSDVYIGEDDKPITLKDNKEPEIVLFNKLNNSIGIQGHPEWMDMGTMFVNHCLDLIKEKVLT